MSSIGWVDFSPKERQRTLEVLKLLEEPGTLDPLGVGRIRDTFSNLLFPGVTTIQTRARYFLIVPWLFRDLERRSPRSRPHAEADSLERDVITGFRRAREETNADLDGLIGGQAGTSLQQLPSDIYWQGMLTLGIRRREGTPGTFFRELTHPVRPTAVADEADLRADYQSWWDRELPEFPADFWDAPRLNLNLEEASYLRQMILASQPRTLLAHLTAIQTEIPDAARPWDLPGDFLTGMAPDTGEALRHAHMFSLVMRGATILYNLMLSELKPSDRHTPDRYLGIHDEWREEIETRRSELERWLDRLRTDHDWSKGSFWTVVNHANPLAPSASERDFVERWIGFALDADPDLAVRPGSDARSLLQQREGRLKGKRAKLLNSGAREYWVGTDQISSLDYRWSYVKRHLNDIHTGLSGDAG